jgi:YHS domain-containing protein
MRTFPPSLVLVCALLVAVEAAAQVNTNGGDVAIGGYDPVAYFTDGRAVRGRAEHAAEHDGAVFHFASAEHRRMFVGSPARYLPQYGGYCAYAMAQGRLQRIDPDAFTVAGGKLYLNYSLDIRARWLERRDDYIREADRRWPEVRRTAR